MAKKRTIDIFDLLPPEAFVQIDELGYNFLKEHGYDVEGAIESEEKRKEIKKALKANGEELRYSGAFNDETRAILIWYELYRGQEKVATSLGLKFLPKPSEGGENGEGGEDSENQERPSPVTEDNA